MSAVPKGATATILWNDEPKVTEGYYFHFGECPDEDDEDDDRVFYYVDNEQELRKLMQPKSGDFVVISYQLEY